MAIKNLFLDVDGRAPTGRCVRSRISICFFILIMQEYSIHQTYMRRCFELAQRSAGWNAPNPKVGAVVVYNNRIIGEGYHQRCGEAHAEVNAIKSV